ncbi:MAG: indole-3-glycerol phosphate synthase TrpC [Clostridiales Family XIII bacterium]|jgi:indole-3-glycerol phosphate synthase|nr:indole-3-glycerol phosphate synthase TrpC [Clostridiales Family XIII bacterium]
MILDEIAAYTRKRIEEEKECVSMEAMRDAALSAVAREKSATAAVANGKSENAAANGKNEENRLGVGADVSTGGAFPFERALSAPGLSFICELKKASPSRGIIAEDFPYLDIARDYEEAGAAVLSVLTEPKYFQGSAAYLKEIASAARIPVLRKDFIIDPYQIYEAKTIGAAAILLICSILNADELAAYIELAQGLGLSALVEAHDGEEIASAVSAGARVIGVNNRDLNTFEVDVKNSARFRELVPKNVIFVSESGVRNTDDVAALREIGADAVLVGEALMRAQDRQVCLRKLRGAANG